MFQVAKGITKTTSNRHPGHIITNCIQRIQEERRFSSGTDSMQRQESEITRLANTQPPKTNTTFSNNWITTHSSHYQAHLERISDYLIHGKGVWWDEQETEIVFYDTSPISTAEPQTTHLHNTKTNQRTSAGLLAGVL